MTANKFNDIVEKRANQRVNQKIENFKHAVGKAISELLDYKNLSLVYHVDKKDVQNIFKNLSEKKLQTGWPSILWDREREAVSKELLSIMDEMQKALLAPEPSAYDNKPMEISDGK